MNNNEHPLWGMKILMVDDIPENLDILSKILRKAGYDTSFATSGEMAIKASKSILPDLILLDVMMPGIDGYQTCEIFKKDPSIKNIPVIFLSAKTEPADIVKGFRVGGVDYITKPYNQEEVLVRVKTQLKLWDKTKRLENSEKELERSNQDLQVFAATASHDLKSPLKKISLLAQFLEEDCNDSLSKEGKSYISQMEIMVTRLFQMIDSLLEFSQLTSHSKSFDSVDLKNVVQTVTSNLEVQIKENKGSIQTGELPTIIGDPILLGQLFQNLISNSLKFYRPEEPPVIKIDSQPTANGFWNILVEDNGIGFDEQYIDKIFLPFSRLVTRDKYEGSGIGLAICQKIVDHHHGTITCQSQQEKGATFIIALPKKQPN